MMQQEALEILKSGKNVFLTGEPGAGKTHTVNLFTEWLRQVNRNYAITASTGIAATHVSGKTIHSWTGLGIKRAVTDSFLDGLLFKEWITGPVNAAKVLIIDEISMLDATMINNIDMVLRRVRGDDTPFGGIQIVLVGDFFQLPPVVRGDERMQFAFESQAWKDAHLTICYLTEQHRQSDMEFLEILNAMRSGTIEELHKVRLRACTMQDEPDTHLFTHNADVDAMNREELAKIDAKEYVYHMTSSGHPYLVTMLKSQVLAPETLKIKKGAVVMFVKNNFEGGYVNGTVGVIEDFTHGGMPIVRTKDGRTIVPTIAEWMIERNGFPEATVKQLPLRLAWAITVHKSQGMSLDCASIDLSRAFEYGQGYVAISRVRTLSGLHLKGLNAKAFEMHPRVVDMDVRFRTMDGKELYTEGGTVYTV